MKIETQLEKDSTFVHRAKYNDMHLWASATETWETFSDVHDWRLSEQISLLLPLTDDSSFEDFSTSGPLKKNNKI